jgi:hypothetical protein
MMAWLMTTWHEKASVRPNYVVLLAEVTSVLTSRLALQKNLYRWAMAAPDPQQQLWAAVWDNVGAQTQNAAS